MKICIDTFPISRLKNNGLSNYSLQFLKKLLESYPSPSYDFIWDSSNKAINFGKNKKLTYVNLFVDRTNNDFSSIEYHLENNNFNIYHCLNNGLSIPKNKNCTYITTVLNLLPAVDPSLVDESYLNKFNTLFKDSIEKCDKIITLSENLKKDLMLFYKIPGSKIEVIYPNFSEIFTIKNKEECKKILSEEFQISYPYILFSGSIQKRKDLETLFTIFKGVERKLTNLKLLIAGSVSGKRKDYYLKLKELLKVLRLEDSVFFLGEVDYNLMPYLYNGAECTVNLSKYEGFSLSIIESIACGCPVLCSNIPIFREILGRKGILLERENLTASINSLVDLLEDRNYRESVIEDQREVLKKFNGEESIKKIVRLYEYFIR